MGITRSGQERFHYKPRELSNLEQVLSPERLASYKSQVSGNLKKAIKLHERNTAISSALYVPMQGVEVALHNSIHSVLSQAFQRQDWYDDESMHLLALRSGLWRTQDQA